MSNHINISAVIIACNEEKHIADCIKSILPITKDIVLVDSGSTDDTIKIAQSIGAKVYHHQWQGYGANKNFGNSKASYDWILSIDADEILDSQLQNEILSLYKKGNVAYMIKSIVNYDGKWIKHCGWTPDWKLRLFNKHKAKWNLDPVHEKLIYPPNTKLVRLKGQLLHYSYDTPQDHYDKTMKYARLKAEKWVNNDVKVSWIKRLFGPSFRFVKTYFFNLGILDGKAGYLISKTNALMIREAIAHFDRLTYRR